MAQEILIIVGIFKILKEMRRGSAATILFFYFSDCGTGLELKNIKSYSKETDIFEAEAANIRNEMQRVECVA